MKENYSIERFSKAAALLPLRFRRLAEEMTDAHKSAAEEFRLRAGQAMTVLLPAGEMTLGTGKEVVQSADLEQLCDRLTDYSRYASMESIAQGYITVQGGFRVGLCGSVAIQADGTRNMRRISSVAIRIGKEKLGISSDVLPLLFDGERFCSTVIVAPPGAGKTTLLRDMIRSLSDGEEGRTPLRIGLVDERSEIASMYHGEPQFFVGAHTDVLDGCPKAAGMEMMLRSMNPQVIALDEITAQQDLQLMAQAAHGGVALLATLHAKDVPDAKQKKMFAKLLRMQVFSRAVCIDRSNQGRAYRVEEL